MSKVTEILESLCSVEGVKGAFLIHQDGQIENSTLEDNMEIDEISQLITRCIRSGNDIAGTLNDEPLKQCIIEFSDSNMTLDILSNGSALALVASSGANLGRIRLEIRKTKKEIEELIV